MSKKDEFSIEEFLENEKKRTEQVGFFEELSTNAVKNSIMRSYNREFVRIYFLEKVVPNADEFILYWKKRFRPLTEEGLDKIF